MTGSVALDVVIGLTFIFLLYSLLGTVICEMVAIHLGLRARNLHLAIRRMLEDSPSTSGLKLTAFIKNIFINIYNFLWHPQGTATCIFYHLPVIKYLGRNSYYSKPSYINNQNFSKAIIEISRRYGGDEAKTDLEKIQNVLNGTLQYEGILNEIRNTINKETKVENTSPMTKVDYSVLRKKLAELVNSDEAKKTKDEAQRKLLFKIKKLVNYSNPFWKIKHLLNPEKSDKAVIYEIDETLNIFGHETRSHLQSLLKDANNDLAKFRLYLEQWFDDTMERAASWYKQKVQFVLLVVGFVLALAFNANTIEIVGKLSVDTDARDKLVQMAGNYVSNPNNNPQRVADIDSALKRKVDSLWVNRLDSLEKIRTDIQQDASDANSLLGLGWDFPDSLQLMNVDNLKKLKMKNGVHVIKSDSVYHSFLNSLIKFNKGKNTIDSLELGSAKKQKFIIIIPTHLNSSLILKSLTSAGYSTSKIEFPKISYLKEAFKTGFWGYLITALAISLGAPFWFDMLNKLIQLRGSVKDLGSASGSSPSTDPAHS